MSDLYGSDYMTIVDEDGTEYELEVLDTIEFGGCQYLAVIPADGEHNALEVCIGTLLFFAQKLPFLRIGQIPPAFLGIF